jgi:hypothetical protein
MKLLDIVALIALHLLMLSELLVRMLFWGIPLLIENIVKGPRRCLHKVELGCFAPGTSDWNGVCYD